MNHYVYRILDPETKEFYFGVRTCSCLPEEDDYMGSYKRWNPNDKQRLSKIILAKFDKRKKALDCEHKLINKFVSHPKNKNYHNNRRFTFYNGVHSEESRKKISKGLKGRNKTKEHREKIKKNHAKPHLGKDSWNKGKKCPQLAGENHGMFGKHHSIESKKKMGRAVVQISKKGEYIKEYYSMAEAEKETGIPKQNIQKCCVGERNTAGGFRWEDKEAGG